MNEGKSQAKAKSCVFFGYHESIKGNRFWDTVVKRCFMSRSVTFDEDATLTSIKVADQNSKDIRSNKSLNEVDFPLAINQDTQVEYTDDDDVTSDHIDKTANVNSDIEETLHELDLQQYSLVRDKTKRVPEPILRYEHADHLIVFTLNVSEETDSVEPKTCWKVKMLKIGKLQ